MFDSFKKLFADKPEPKSQARDAEAYKREGKDHVRAGNWNEAAQNFRAAVDLKGDDVDALVSLGFALLQQGTREGARDVLAEAVRLAPDNADAHYMLGSIARATGDSPTAIRHLTKAIELQPLLVDGYRDLSILYFDAGQTEAARDTITKGISVDGASAELRMILGNILDHAKDHQGAIAAYQSGLSIQPDSPQLHNNMGNALRALGRIGPATTSYRAALSFQPDFADAHINLGNAMRDEGRLPDALAHFKHAIASAPGEIRAHVGAAGILVTLNRAEEALALLAPALARHPQEMTLMFAQATALTALRRTEEARATLEEVIRIQPGFVSAYIELGNLFVQTGKRGEAVAAYRKAVDLDPANPVAHLISALSGDSTERAPDKYVASLFDFYADKFDSHLVGTLKYNIPNELAEQLRTHFGPDRARWDVLDLGCGTGLAGAAIAANVGSMVGVDLSEKMLAKARERNIYSRLEQADLLTMMQKEPPESFDVIVAADVFVYVGRLDDLTGEANRLLRPGGVFAFSVEGTPGSLTAAGDDRGYRLNDTGRYSHSRPYLDDLASAGRFTVLEIKETVVRVNEGKPVAGFVVLFRR